jgi:hypothetical protein
MIVGSIRVGAPVIDAVRNVSLAPANSTASESSHCHFAQLFIIVDGPAIIPAMRSMN